MGAATCLGSKNFLGLLAAKNELGEVSIGPGS
jgi:hypothetical protein